MATMKVYTWQGFHRAAPGVHNQVRYILAARSKAEVYRTTGRTPSWHFNLGDTGNRHDIAAALAKPGRILWRALDAYGGRGEYHEGYEGG